MNATATQRRDRNDKAAPRTQALLADTAGTGAVANASPRSSALNVTLALARLSIGFVFLWAFVDKLFGFGFATPSERAWINGGSPTSGFLSVVEGPFKGFFNGMAGYAWADWLIMVGLSGIGVACMARCEIWCVP